MCNRKSRLFKFGCLFVGISYAVIAASVLLQGVIPFMKQFGLPEATLNSPHYENAIFFHFYDMFVIGVLIATAGFVESLRFQRVFSLAMSVIQSVYLYLDVKTSDTFLGNGLYEGPGSVTPVVIGLAFTTLFLTLAISAFRYRVSPSE